MESPYNYYSSFTSTKQAFGMKIIYVNSNPTQLYYSPKSHLTQFPFFGASNLEYVHFNVIPAQMRKVNKPSYSTFFL